MSQHYPPPVPPQFPQKRKRLGCGALSVIAVLAFFTIVALIAIGAASSKSKSSSPGADAKPPTASSSSSRPASGPPPKLRTIVDDFKSYVAKHGTRNEIAASKHVTKIQGADGDTNLVDLSDIYTDYSGDITGPNTGHATLIASSFADFQASRGKNSKNGLVTVYSADGTPLSNGKY